MSYSIKRVVVIGSGTMGGGIAAHAANAGIPVYLLDLAPRELTPEEEKRAVLLPNHGAITIGDNIQVALLRMLLLEGMVERNLSVAQAARSLGHDPVPIAPEAARRAKAEIARIPVLPLLWKDFLTRLRATDPDLFEVMSDE